MEAEYYAVHGCVREGLFLRMLFDETGLKVQDPLVIYEDNRACIAFSKNQGDHKRTKHIDYRHHLVREVVEVGEFILEPISTYDQLADIFTKALDPPTFLRFRQQLVQSKRDVIHAANSRR